MKKRILDFAGFVLFYVGVIFVILLLSPFGRGAIDYWRRKHELATAPDVREVAQACLQLVQMDPEHPVHFMPPDFDGLPEVLKAKSPKAVWGSLGEVNVEFGGGFYHYGYRLEPMPEGTRQWRFLLYGEAEGDVRELLRLP